MIYGYYVNSRSYSYYDKCVMLFRTESHKFAKMYAKFSVINGVFYLIQQRRRVRRWTFDVEEVTGSKSKEMAPGHVRVML